MTESKGRTLLVYGSQPALLQASISGTLKTSHIAD